jgi:hypothetical protein
MEAIRGFVHKIKDPYSAGGQAYNEYLVNT